MQNSHLGRLALVGFALLASWIGQGLLLADLSAPADKRSPAGIALLAAGIAVFIGMSAWALRDRGRPPREPSPGAGRLRGLLSRIPRPHALLALALLCAGVAFWLAALPGMDSWPALFAWLGSIGLLLAAARALPSAPPAADAAPAVPFAGWEWAALAALTLAALLLRTWNIGHLPANFGGDEGEMGMAARAVLYGQDTRPFVTGWLSHPMLWFFMQAGSLLIFGDTVFGLRMLSALLGTAAVPLLYGFARPLYGRAVALTAAGLLTTYHFHIHFSRLGANNIADPLLALAAFAAFFHGYRRGSTLAFALSGVLLGAAMHFYMGARLAPLVLAGVLLHQLLFGRGRVWQLRWQLALMALAFFVGFGPLLAHFIRFPEDFTARLAMVGVFQSGWFESRVAAGQMPLDLLREQAYSGFGVYTFAPDRSAWYDPEIPLLDQTSATLFLLGLALALARFRRPESPLLVGWLVGASIFGGMMIVNLESPRFVTTAPALCLLIATALGQIGSLAAWALGHSGARRGVLALGLLALAVWNLNFYFRDYTPRVRYGWVNTEAATALGEYMQELPPGTFVYMLGPPRMYLGNGTIRFIAGDVPGADVSDPLLAPEELPPMPEGARPVFVFMPERLKDLAVVQQRFPEGRLEQRDARGEDGQLFAIYEPR